MTVNYFTSVVQSPVIHQIGRDSPSARWTTSSHARKYKEAFDKVEKLSKTREPENIRWLPMP